MLCIYIYITRIRYVNRDSEWQMETNVTSMLIVTTQEWVQVVVPNQGKLCGCFSFIFKSKINEPQVVCYWHEQQPLKNKLKSDQPIHQWQCGLSPLCTPDPCKISKLLVTCGDTVKWGMILQLYMRVMWSECRIWDQRTNPLTKNII